MNDPLQPNDPLWNLLGKAKQPEIRGNFVPDVLREARQTPQSRGWWTGVVEWFQDSPAALPRLAVAAAAVAALVGLTVMQISSPQPQQAEVAAAINITETSQSPAVAEPPLVADVESQWENTEHIDALLAMEDVSTFTDSEIAFLLY